MYTARLMALRQLKFNLFWPLVHYNYRAHVDFHSKVSMHHCMSCHCRTIIKKEALAIENHTNLQCVVPKLCRQNPHFIGRTLLLEMLRDKLYDNQPRQFNHQVTLFGMGGVGKTQVAIEYVIKYKMKYNAVFWITAANSASLLLGYQQMTTLTECIVTAAMDAESVVREVLKLEKQVCWLLVLDNIDDISVVHGYLPELNSGEGHVLITTRNRDATGIPAEGLEVGVFESQAAADLLLLQSKLSDSVNAEMRLEAVKIVSELGFLALAIEQAAAFIRESLKDIFKFLVVYSANSCVRAVPRPLHCPLSKVVFFSSFRR
jgi:hypothetical protein